jgi:hypothetical protein
MAYSESSSFFVPGVVASGTITQYSCVKFASTVGAFVVGTSCTSKLMGILQDDPADGAPGLVQHMGVAKALCESSVTYGDLLKCDTTGRVKTINTATTSTVVGRALQNYSTAGGIISVLLHVGFS